MHEKTEVLGRQEVQSCDLSQRNCTCCFKLA